MSKKKKLAAFCFPKLVSPIKFIGGSVFVNPKGEEDLIVFIMSQITMARV